MAINDINEIQSNNLNHHRAIVFGVIKNSIPYQFSSQQKEMLYSCISDASDANKCYIEILWFIRDNLPRTYISKLLDISVRDIKESISYLDTTDDEIESANREITMLRSNLVR